MALMIVSLRVLGVNAEVWPDRCRRSQYGESSGGSRFHCLKKPFVNRRTPHRIGAGIISDRPVIARLEGRADYVSAHDEPWLYTTATAHLKVDILYISTLVHRQTKATNLEDRPK